VVKNESSKLGEDGASVNERGCAVERATQCMVGEHDDSLSQQHQKCLRQFMASKIVRWQAERAYKRAFNHVSFRPKSADLSSWMYSQSE
jgi:hypothetical protein